MGKKTNGKRLSTNKWALSILPKLDKLLAGMIIKGCVYIMTYLKSEIFSRCQCRKVNQMSVLRWRHHMNSILNGSRVKEGHGEIQTFFLLSKCGFPNPRLSNASDGLSSLQFSDNIVWKMSLSCRYRCRLSAPPLLSNAIFALCRFRIFAYFIDNRLAGMYRFLSSSNLTMKLLDHSCVSYYFEMYY